MLKSLGEEEVVGVFGAFGGPLLDLLATSLLGVGAPVTTRATRMGRGTNYITSVLKTGKCLRGLEGAQYRGAMWGKTRQLIRRSDTRDGVFARHSRIHLYACSTSRYNE